jgi:hypothetical protein
LNSQKIIFKVFECIHEKLGHNCDEFLENFTQEKIHCALCKPRVVKETSEKLVSMSTGKYISESIFNKALAHLKELKHHQKFISRIHPELQQKSANQDDKSIEDLIKKIGEIVISSEGQVEGQESVLNDLVSYLTSYIVNVACEEIAEEFVMNLSTPKNTLPNHVRQEVKQLLSMQTLNAKVRKPFSFYMFLYTIHFCHFLLSLMPTPSAP